MAKFAAKNLSFTYSGSKKPALCGLSFEIQNGEFISLAGETGSGKSTLLRCLKPELTPNGELCGDLLFNGRDISKSKGRLSAEKIGFVGQHPEHQIVTDKVWHELAFAAENLGIERDEIRRRVAETACFFGIEHLFERSTAALSGGQKQLLTLASVMVTNPDVLILDEPTARLDPVAAAEFLSVVSRLNSEFGTTVIISEHRLEQLFSRSDKILALKDGRTLCFCEPENAAREMGTDGVLCRSLPAAARLFSALGLSGSCPLSVKEGGDFLYEKLGHFPDSQKTAEKDPRQSGAAAAAASRIKEARKDSRPKALEMKDAFFRFEKSGEDILKGLSLTVYEGEIFFILGGNGSGKTTALSVAAGIKKAYSGKVKIFEKSIEKYKGGELYRGLVSLLPQDIEPIFLKDTVADELKSVDRRSYDFLPLDDSLLSRHPYDLSGGQQQILGLLKALSTKPRLLLLDEPTKGLDSASKLALSSALKQLKETGMTIVAVTHDAEFAADTADRCAMFFRGQNVCAAPSRDFFKSGSFYTTPFVPMTKGFFEDTPVTLADTVAAYSQAICHRKQAAALNGETTSRCDTAPRNEAAEHDESVARSGRAVGCDEPSCRGNDAVFVKCPQKKGGRK